MAFTHKICVAGQSDLTWEKLDKFLHENQTSMPVLRVSPKALRCLAEFMKPEERFVDETILHNGAMNYVLTEDRLSKVLEGLEKEIPEKWREP